MFNKKPKVKKEKTLKEVDNKILNDMRDKTVKQSEELTNINNIINLACKKCGRELDELNPKIKMGDMTLHECRGCKEREYI